MKKTSADASGDNEFEPMGETALLLRWGTHIDAAVSDRVHAASATLLRANLPGIVDIVPAYAALALHYDPLSWSDGNGGLPWQHVASAVRSIFATPPVGAAQDPVVVEIPVCYGGEFGPDLAAVAHQAKLDSAEVIERHTRADYRVAMIGFAPGFPYLLGLDPALHTPRRASPRTRVPAGSVAIGGAQTGIYPTALPGGWQLIGRTPAVLFDPHRAQASLLGPGDHVRFIAIDAADYASRTDVADP